MPRREYCENHEQEVWTCPACYEDHNRRVTKCDNCGAKLKCSKHSTWSSRCVLMEESS